MMTINNEIFRLILLVRFRLSYHLSVLILKDDANHMIIVNFQFQLLITQKYYYLLD